MKKIIITILSILSTLFVASIIYIIYIVKYVDYKYTGQELFDAVNIHRTSENIQPLELDLTLCWNLEARWLGIKEMNGGLSFEAWLGDQGLVDNNSKILLPYTQIGDVYGTNSTPDNLIFSWLGVPGRRLVLEKPEFNVGCAYAKEGTSILILAVKE